MLAPVAAVADAACDELWLTRNIVFDRAGHCFGSALGQSVFDNSDCQASGISLSGADEQFVAEVRAAESDFGCKVDTSRTSLDVRNVLARQALMDLPILATYESACLGYIGEPLLLTAGNHPEAAFSGEILQGMNILFTHLPRDGMEFVDLGNGEMGWVGANLITSEVCTAMAG